MVNAADICPVFIHRVPGFAEFCSFEAANIHDDAEGLVFGGIPLGPVGGDRKMRRIDNCAVSLRRCSIIRTWSAGPVRNEVT